MTRAPSVVLVVALLSMLSGCAQLSVTVQVLDREKIPADKKLESNVWLEAQRHVAQVETGYYERLEQSLVVDLTRAVDVLIKEKVVRNKNQETVRATLVTQLHDYARQTVRGAKQRSDEGLRIYESIRDKSSADNQKQLSEALVALQDGRNRLLTISEDAKTNLKSLVEHLSTEGIASLDKVADSIDSSLKATRKLALTRNPLFGGSTLFDDPLASWVVNADEAAWNGRFNKGYGGGFLGNADIAMKMEADGVFTMKGVRLDASKTTEAAFAVIRQGINIAAAGSGLPVVKGTPKSTTATTGSTSTATDPPDVSGEMLASADAARQAEKHQREQAQYAMSAILEVIARNAKRIDGTSAERTDAIEQIKAVYAAYKPLMQVVTEGTNP